MKHSVLVLLLTAYFSSSAFAQANGAQSLTVVSAVAPVFPPNAVAVGLSGDVTVEVEVDERGEVRGARHIGAHPLLRKPSESAARRWRFAPLAIGEKKRVVRLIFSFRIMPLNTPADELSSVFVLPYRIEVRREKPESIVHRDPPGYTIPPKRERKQKRQ